MSFITSKSELLETPEENTSQNGLDCCDTAPQKMMNLSMTVGVSAIYFVTIGVV